MRQVWNYAVWLAIALNAVSLGWQAWAVFKQKSGEAVSVLWFASSLGLEAVNIIYGYRQGSSVFIYNAIVCAAGQVLVLWALKAYKPFGFKEKLVLSAELGIVGAACLLPFKNIAQMAAQGLNLYGGADQPLTLKAAGGTGALKLLSLLTSALSSVIWAAYSLEHFGFWGPAVGYIVYTAYVLFMVWQWYKKASADIF